MVSRQQLKAHNTQGIYRYLLLTLTAMLTTQNSQANNLFDLSLEDLLNIEITSASMFTETRQQAAATVTRIDETQWQQWGARQNLDALNGQVGIETYQATWGGSALAIRGFTQLLSVRGIATQIDGVSVNDLLLGSAQYDNEHISLGVVDNLELIKGPGSTLYGTDAFHGVLSFNTYQSTKNELRLNSQVGSFDYSQTSLKGSHDLGGQFINVAFDSRRQHHWGQEYFNVDQNQIDERSHKYENTTALIKLHNGEGNIWDYQVSLYHNRFDGNDFIAGGKSFGYQDRDVSSSEHNLSMAKAQLEYQITDASELGVKTSYWEMERDNPFANRCCNMLVWQHQVDRYQIQGYWRWQNDEGSRLHAAIEHSYQKVNEETTLVLDSNNQVVSTTTGNGEGHSRNVDSLVVQGRWQTGFQPLKFELGLRLDDYSDFGEQWSPRIGTIYDFAPQHTFKLLYGTAFRAAVTVEMLGTSSIEGDPNIKPEELETLEWVYQFHGKQWQHELTLFRTNWDNGIIAVPNGTGKKYENADENESHGVEAATHYMGTHWTIHLAGSWVKSKNTQSNFDYVAFPEWQLKNALNYQFSDKQQLALHTDWRDSRSASPIDSGTPFPAALGSYLSVDALYQHSWTEWLATVAIKNVFNRDNRTPSLVNTPEGDMSKSRTLELALQLQL